MTLDAPTLRAAVETVITLSALAGVWFLRAQFRQMRRLRDLLLLGGLLVLALSDVSFYAFPAALDVQSGGPYVAAFLFANLFVAATFAAAAVVPSDRVVAGNHAFGTVAGISTIAVGIAIIGGLLLRNQLVSAATGPVAGLGNSLRHPLAVFLVLVGGGLSGQAMVSFARSARTDHNGIAYLLTGASILMAAARLYSLALPSLPFDWIAPGEALSLVSAALIFAAVVRQEVQMRMRLAQAAVMEERRRVARDLHDGLAQDLAVIAAHRILIAEQFGAGHPLAVAASRALAISRGTITELTDSTAVTLGEALQATAMEMRHRFDIDIEVDTQFDAEIGPDAREHLVRIAREAIANAARHGHAENVIVSVRQTRKTVVLRVRDDGSGIAHVGTAAAPEGFGLRSMRERAVALGGHLVMHQPESGGTELEVSFS